MDLSDVSRSLRLLVAGSILCLAIVGEPSRAAADDRPDFRVEGVANVPVQFGVGGLLELPLGLRAGGSIGYLPTSFVGVANDFLVPLSSNYSQQDAKLVEQSLGRSMAWRLHAGWSPPLLGLYLQGGYSMTTFGGSAPSIQLIESLTDTKLPDSRSGGSGDRTFRASSTLHQLTIGVGWDWKLGPLRLRTGVGWSYTFGSSARLEADFNPRNERLQRAIDALEKEGEAYLNETYRDHLHPPWATVALGWTFF